MSGFDLLRAAEQAGSDVERHQLCERAEESCSFAVELEEHAARGYNCLGLIELVCHGRTQSASEAFEAAIARDRDYAEAHNNLGVTFVNRSPADYDRAVREFMSALQIDPANFDARENLAWSLIQLRRWDDARDQCVRRMLEGHRPTARARTTISD